MVPERDEGEFVPTDGTAIDHIAFAYADIGSAYERMKAAGVKIVRPISTDGDSGVESFFVRGPDQLLVEIVEERAVPDGIWR